MTKEINKAINFLAMKKEYWDIIDEYYLLKSFVAEKINNTKVNGVNLSYETITAIFKELKLK